MAEVWPALQYILWIILLLCVLVWLGLHLRRVLYNRYYPNVDLRFYDISGHLKLEPRNEIARQYPTHTAGYHIINGYVKLFQKEGVMVAWFFYLRLIGLCKADAVEQLFSGAKNTGKGKVYKLLHSWLGTGLLTSDGDKWKTRRKLLTPAFHFDILKEFLPIMNEQSETLIRILRKDTEKPWIDIVKPIKLCTLDIICETILGVNTHAQEDSQSEYVQAVTRTGENTIERMMRPLLWLDIIYRFTRRGRQYKRDLTLLHTFTRKVIKERKQSFLNSDDAYRKKKRKAMLDLLLQEHIHNNSITEEDIREEVDTFTFEGHDTTSMGICWSLYCIGLYKEAQAAIVAELHSIFGNDNERPVTTDDLRGMKYLECVLKESLRLYPPVPMLARETDEEINIRGYRIPKGALIGISVYDNHRDPEYFSDPEKFIPDRFLPENSTDRHPFAYIPFSAGPRNCIGQRFAMMELKVIIANILRNFTLHSLDHRDKLLLTPELILKSAHPLRIKISNRQCSLK